MTRICPGEAADSTYRPFSHGNCLLNKHCRPSRPCPSPSPSYIPRMLDWNRIYERMRDRTSVKGSTTNTRCSKPQEKTVGKSLQSGFRDWVKRIPNETKCHHQIGKWARGRETASGGVILALKMTNNQLAKTNEHKVQVLREAFLKTPPGSDSDKASNWVIPPTKRCFMLFAEHRLIRLLGQMLS